MMTEDADDVTLNFGEEDELQQKKKFIHPIAVGFHLGFRTLAMISYLLCGIFSSSFIASFVVIILFLSMDFWTVKNVSGRLLVGLRWWNHIDEEGNSHWVYEKRKPWEVTVKSLKDLVVDTVITVVNSLLSAVFKNKDQDQIKVEKKVQGSLKNSGTESRVFWLSLVITQVLWVVFFFACLFSVKLKWLMIVCIGLVLNGANLYGYLRCKVGTRQKLSSMATNFLGAQMLKNMFSRSQQSETDQTNAT